MSRTSAEDRALTKKFAREIATVLGSEWQYDTKHNDDPENDTYPTMYIRNGEETVTVRVDWKSSDRLVLGVNFPFPDPMQYLPYDTRHWPSITVAQTKTAQQIVKDIERRLLPVYREQLAIATAKKKEVDDREFVRADYLKRLATLVGSEPNRNGNRPEKAYFSFGDVSGEVEVHYDGEVSLKLSRLQFDTAEKLLKQLVKAFKEAANQPS